MQHTQRPSGDEKSFTSLRGVSHTWGQEKTDTRMSATPHLPPTADAVWASPLGTVAVLSQWNDSKYFLRAKTVNSATKLENFQTYFSITWVFGIFKNTFLVNCALLVHRSKQPPKALGACVVRTFLLKRHWMSAAKSSTACVPYLFPGQPLPWFPPTKGMSHVWVSWSFVNCGKLSQIFFFR